MLRPAAAAVVVRSLLIAAVAAAPAVGQNNPFEPTPQAASKFAGAFSGEGTQMTLTPDGRGGYSGAFVMNGASYPLTATEQNGGLSGSFTANGQPFPFTAQPQADGSLVVTSGNGKRTLQRAAAIAPQPPQPPQPQPQPVVPDPPPVNNAVATGGIGMRAEPKDGKLVVTALMPGGPAEKSKVPIGGVIRMVDRQRVDGMNQEQVGQLIRGQPGTLVTVTIETANEVTDYVLTRADLGQPQPNPQPGPVADAGVVRPGFRATWATMMVPVPGATVPLNQNEQNNWVDGQTGQPIQNFNPQPTPGNAAYQQMTIVAADQRDLAADLRMHVLVDAQQKTSIEMQSGSVVAQPGGNLGDFYVPPANLARMAAQPQQPQPGSPYTFKRIQYPMGGQTYDAMSIRMKTSQGFQHNIYEMKTGLLLVSGASMVSAQPQLDPQQQQQQQQPFPNQQQQPQPFPQQQPQGFPGGEEDAFPAQGQAQPFPGQPQPFPGQQQPFPNPQPMPGQQQPFPGQQQPPPQVVVQIMRLVDQRQLDLPWANQAAPAWMRSGARLDYVGTVQDGNAQDGNAPQPLRVTASFAVGDARPTWAPVRQEVRVDGQPQAQTTQRAIGNHAADPLYIDPQILARLQPNQAIDEDRSTQRRVTFAGVQGNAAYLLEQSPTTTNRYGYDPRTGVLTSLESTLRTPAGQQTIRVQLQNPPQ